MKKTQDAIIIYHEESTDQSENEISAHSSPANSTHVDKSKTNHSLPKSKDKSEAHAVINDILNLDLNAFYNDKRKWNDSFTVAEQKASQGNIVKAAKDNDGETYVTLQEEVVYAQPRISQTEEESQDSDDSDQNRKSGRELLPDEVCLSDPDKDPNSKRKEQNRAAQRAFRERKEKYVKNLETKLKQMQDSSMVTINQLLGENQQLRAIVYRLEMENSNLKGVPFQPYQSELNSVPHHSPFVHPQQHQRIGNYPQIAPLIPKSTYAPSSQALPAFSATSMGNQMALLPVPYSMNSMLNSTDSPSSAKKTVSKKTAAKQQKRASSQPLEYTFSISTPTSLRPSYSDSSSSKQDQPSEPVKPVRLYPSSEKSFNQKGNDAVRSTPPAESSSQKDELYNKNIPSSSSQNDTSSVVSTESSKKIDQLESDFIQCHIDSERQSFSERLHNEVCHDAFNLLLSEPLFDQMGKLNFSIAPCPMVSLEDKENKSATKNEQDFGRTRV